MRSFDLFCTKNKIEYVAAYGTVIGAVRHKGLIPWDDDIDVFMDWDNYNRFTQLKSEALKIGYSIVDRKNKGYYLPVAKYVNNHTTIWEHETYPFVYGVFIDVFPLGYVNNIEESKKIHELYLYHSKMLACGYKRYSLSMKNLKHFVGHATEVIDCFRERNKIELHQLELDELDAKISKIHNGAYRLYYRSMDTFGHSLFRSEWFEKTIRVKFEDFEIPIPEGYHKYLTTCYGDYMTPPPVEKQKSHHSHYYINLKEGLTLEETKKRINKGETVVF
jgi:lipopolysaccharide cholinephosphotransferase